MTLDLILVGFGNVGRRFALLLREQAARLAQDHELATRIVAIVTRRHGCAASARGLDAVALSRAPAIGPPAASTVDFLDGALSRSAAAARDGRLVLIETTTLDITQGEPAISHVRQALAAGAHVVTANKGPAAFAYQSLTRAAGAVGRRVLFEGAVMDGIPLFNLVRETLPGVEIVGFRGIVNTTTNYMLNALELGQHADDALREMQAMGVAEADASLDVEGWDAAAKTAALANALMGASLTPQRVERHGITPHLAARAIAARSAGRRLKLVARAGYDRGRIAARVGPEELRSDDLLAGVDGQQNAIVLHTDLLGEIAIVQRGSGLVQTAYALVSDLVTISRDRAAARATRPLRQPARRGRSR